MCLGIINGRCSPTSRGSVKGAELRGRPHGSVSTYQLPTPSGSEHPSISKIASQSRRKSVGELTNTGSGACGDRWLSVFWMGGRVGEFSRSNCGITDNDVFSPSSGRTYKHERLRGARGPPGFRLRAARWRDLSPSSASMRGVFRGEEDEDAMLESDASDAVEAIERRVGARHRPVPRKVQGHMSRCSLDNESNEDDVQLQGRGPLTRCVFLRVKIGRG